MIFREEWTYEVAIALQHLVGSLSGASREGFEEAFRRLARELPPPIGQLESMWLTETLSNVCWRAGTSFHARHHSPRSPMLCRMPALHEVAGIWALARKSPRFKLCLWLSRFLRPFDLHHPPALAVKAAKRLQRRPATTITTSELARRLGCSVSVLVRHFLTRYGLTPAEYRTRVRLRAAVGLLRQTNMKIECVARESGYRNPANFYVALMKETGKSPASIRRLTDTEIQHVLNSYLSPSQPAELVRAGVACSG